MRGAIRHVGFLLLLGSLPACDRDLAAFVAVQDKLEALQAERRVLIAQFQPEGEEEARLRSEWTKATPQAATESLQGFLEAHVPEPVRVHPVTPANHAAVEVGGRGGGREIKAVVDGLAELASALILRRVELDSDGTWRARIELPERIPAKTEPAPAEVPPAPYPAVPPVDWLASSRVQAVGEHLQALRAELPVLDRAVAAGRARHDRVVQLKADLESLRTKDRVGYVSFGVGRLFAGDPGPPTSLNGRVPALSYGRWELQGTTVKVEGGYRVHGVATRPAPPLDAQAIRLLAWQTAFGDTIRRLFGASVNALANEPSAALCELADEPGTREGLAAETPEETDCSICAFAKRGWNLSGMEGQGQLAMGAATALTLAQSTYALCNRTPKAEELPAPGGLTLDALAQRACQWCPPAEGS